MSLTILLICVLNWFARNPDHNKCVIHAKEILRKCLLIPNIIYCIVVAKSRIVSLYPVLSNIFRIYCFCFSSTYRFSSQSVFTVCDLLQINLTEGGVLDYIYRWWGYLYYSVFSINYSEIGSGIYQHFFLPSFETGQA